MEYVTLKQVDNGWMLIWDDHELSHPFIIVKEGMRSIHDGLIDDFVATFLLPEYEDFLTKEGLEFQVQINVVEIKHKERDV